MKSSNRRLAILGASFGLLALAGCAKNKGELVVDDSVGVTALRSPCPLVAIPEMTGDITLFNAPGRTDSGAIDVVASITNLRSTCNDETNGSKLDSAATFDVLARRTDTRGARHIEIPYFSVVMRGGTQVLAKRVGTIGLDFADGQDRASARASAGASVDRAEATLPREIRNTLTRKRKAGDADAATDPLAQPEVKAALARASFELLVGFQLTNDQLAYNATR